MSSTNLKVISAKYKANKVIQKRNAKISTVLAVISCVAAGVISDYMKRTDINMSQLLEYGSIWLFDIAIAIINIRLMVRSKSKADMYEELAVAMDERIEKLEAAENTQIMEEENKKGAK